MTLPSLNRKTPSLRLDFHKPTFARITSTNLRGDLWESEKINTFGETLRRD